MSGAARATRVFKGHPLPDLCPPMEATACSVGKLLRLVAVEHPTADHFRSCHAENKKKPKGCDDCAWVACSVWLESTPRERLADLAKLPNHSDKKYIATISVTATSGKIRPHPKDGNHLSFWMYEDFDIKQAVVKVEPL